MYLTRSLFTLFQLLRKSLNYPLKNKDEQQFIHTRLELLDQHYYLEVELQLWQSYLHIGVEKHQWPVSFLSVQIFIYCFSYNNKRNNS